MRLTMRQVLSPCCYIILHPLSNPTVFKSYRIGKKKERRERKEEKEEKKRNEEIHESFIQWFSIFSLFSLIPSVENVLAVRTSVRERIHGCHRDQSSRKTRRF